MTPDENAARFSASPRVSAAAAAARLFGCRSGLQTQRDLDKAACLVIGGQMEAAPKPTHPHTLYPAFPCIPHRSQHMALALVSWLLQQCPVTAVLVSSSHLTITISLPKLLLTNLHPVLQYHRGNSAITDPNIPRMKKQEKVSNNERNEIVQSVFLLGVLIKT